MNSMQLLKTNGIDSDLIDLESYSSDIEFKDYAKNEYGLILKDGLKSQFLDAQAQLEKIEMQKANQLEIEKLNNLELEKKEALAFNPNAALKQLFSKPKIIGIVGDANSGKSNLLYYLLDNLRNDYNFKVVAYGLRNVLLNVQAVYSIEEIEQVKNSVLIIDEFDTLFDLDNRKEKRQVEKSLRLIFHNNNILVLSGVPENFKKFISAKLNAVLFKKTRLHDLINGSGAKDLAVSYKGLELGSSVLDIKDNEALFYDGEHYHKIKVPYLAIYDTKKDNVSILSKKESVPDNVHKINDLKCAEKVI